MSTIQNLIDEVRGYVNEPSTVSPGFYDNTELLNYFKRNVYDLCVDTDVNYKQYVYTAAGAETSLTIPQITGSAETRILALDFLLIKQAGDSYYRDLKKVAPDTRYNSTSSTTTNVNCQFFGDKLYFNQALTATDSIIIAGRFLNTSVTDVTSTYPFDLMCEEVSINKATSISFLKAEKLEVAKAWMDMHIEKKKQVKDYYAKLVLFNYPSTVSVDKKSGIGLINRLDYSSIP